MSYDSTEEELIRAAEARGEIYPKRKCIGVEEARSILEAQGFTVSEPKTGKVYVSESISSGGIHYDKYKLNPKLYRTLAVLDWKQGDGL